MKIRIQTVQHSRGRDAKMGSGTVTQNCHTSWRGTGAEFFFIGLA
jgi:hypothetical protein